MSLEGLLEKHRRLFGKREVKSVKPSSHRIVRPVLETKDFSGKSEKASPLLHQQRETISFSKALPTGDWEYPIVHEAYSQAPDIAPLWDQLSSRIAMERRQFSQPSAEEVMT